MKATSWELKRNCSLYPAQLWRFYVVICVVSLTIALICTWRGAWMVLIFAVFEQSCLGLAFLIYALHATDREVVTLSLSGNGGSGTQAKVNIERRQAQRVSHFEFPGHALNIMVANTYARQHRVLLQSEGQQLELGSFVSARQRQRFVSEFRQALMVQAIA